MRTTTTTTTICCVVFVPLANETRALLIEAIAHLLSTLIISGGLGTTTTAFNFNFYNFTLTQFLQFLFQSLLQPDFPHSTSCTTPHQQCSNLPRLLFPFAQSPLPLYICTKNDSGSTFSLLFYAFKAVLYSPPQTLPESSGLH